MKHDHKAFAAAAAYKGDTADRIRRFLPMVRRLAWHVHGSGRPGIELEDLVQSGLVALTECARKHAGPTEDGFAAYAKMRVRGAMVDLIRRTVPLSRGGTERRRNLREKQTELRRQLGILRAWLPLASKRLDLRTEIARAIVESKGALPDFRN